MTYYDPILAKANSGDPEAMNQIGERYLAGLDGYPVDEAQAFPWLWKAAECGVASAQHNIGFMYLYGNGIEQNNEEAFRWLKQAAENGFEKSYEQLAISYCNELGTDRNLKLSMYWAQKAITAGSETAQNLMEFIKSEMLTHIDHLNQVKKAAQEGNVSAQAELGIAYFFGQEIEQNINEAVKWFSLAAEGGNAIAQNNLSIMHMDGTGVQKDENASFFWMKKAAENGHQGAYYPLARKYCNGIGTEQNFESALIWAKKAQESGDDNAPKLITFIEEQLRNVTTSNIDKPDEIQQPDQALASPIDNSTASDEAPFNPLEGEIQRYIELGEQYLFCNPANLPEAFFWLKKAAEMGSASAQNNIAVMYGKGDGVAQDDVQAFNWMKKAADNGFERSYYPLAIKYCNGVGTTQSFDDALLWAKKSLELGNEDAKDLIDFLEEIHQTNENNPISKEGFEQNKIGEDYLFGRNGVEKDYTEAFKWLLMAAEKGYATAQNNIGYLYYNGQGISADKEKAFYWMKKAAENAFEISYLPLALKYRDGDGTVKDLHQALSWAKKALDFGKGTPDLITSIETEIKQAEEASKSVSINNANTSLEEIALAGNVDAQFRLAEAYTFAKYGYEKDDDKAFYWTKMSAENGSALGQNNLGVFYLNGTGTAKDLELSFYWTKKAAENNYPAACKTLASKYLNGTGTPVSLTLAMSWAQKAKEFGVPEADKFIAVISNNLKVAETDSNFEYKKGQEAKAEELLKEGKEEEALNLYRELAQMGYATSMYKLGMYYSQKEHINKEEALKWLLMGAEKDNVDCMNRLGFVYCYKTLGDLDDAESTRWYEKAALCGDPHSAIKVANRYLYSSGVEYDLEKALKFAEMAKARGNSFSADPIIKKIQEKMNEAENIIKAKGYYSKGLTLKKEGKYEQSLPLFEEAAKLGLADAYYQIGTMYHYGYGLPIDDHQAYFFSETAARMGNPNAHQNASVFFTLVSKNSGNYPKKVDTKSSLGSIFWVMKAIAAGSTDALKTLEKMKSDYLNSYNLPSDHIILTNLYNDFIHHNYNNLKSNLPFVAKSGNVDGLCFLAYCNEMGVGSFGINLPEALYQYKTAAECGSSYAMYKVGDFYERGVACERNMDVAKECYKLSAKWGYRAAKEKCRELKIK